MAMTDEMKTWLKYYIEDVLSDITTIEELAQAAMIVNEEFEVHRKRILKDEHLE